MCPLLKIAQYYVNIDNREIDKILRLFSPKIRYKRGKLILEGKTNLEKFYRNQRIIESGNHLIQSMTVRENKVEVDGVFKGKLKSGEQANEPFKDIFEFNEGIVVFRQTLFPGGKEI